MFIVTTRDKRGAMDWQFKERDKALDFANRAVYILGIEHIVCRNQKSKSVLFEWHHPEKVRLEIVATLNSMSEDDRAEVLSRIRELIRKRQSRPANPPQQPAETPAASAPL